ncbi:MAG: hypothetical protein ACOH5I_03375 [Oligoflexus sp.]
MIANPAVVSLCDNPSLQGYDFHDYSFLQVNDKEPGDGEVMETTFQVFVIADRELIEVENENNEDSENEEVVLEDPGFKYKVASLVDTSYAAICWDGTGSDADTSVHEHPNAMPPFTQWAGDAEQTDKYFPRNQPNFATQAIPLILSVRISGQVVHITFVGKKLQDFLPIKVTLWATF